MLKAYNVAILGAGVVGLRTAKVLASAQDLVHRINISLVKNTLDQHDERTKELFAFLLQHENIVLYVTGDEQRQSIDAKVANAKTAGCQVSGIFSHDEVKGHAQLWRFDPAEYDSFIDCTAEKSTNITVPFIREHRRFGVPLSVQGGTDPGLVGNMLMFGPHTIGDVRYVPKQDNTIASCNTHAIGYTLAALDGFFNVTDIEYINLWLDRRYKDREDPPKDFQYGKDDLYKQSHHAEDIVRCVPWLKEVQVYSEAKKLPYEHYHLSTVLISLKSAVSDNDFENCIARFKKSPVVAYASQHLFGASDKEKICAVERISRITTGLGFPDGDILRPLVHARKGEQAIFVDVVTSQRSIVAEDNCKKVYIDLGIVSSPVSAHEYLSVNNAYGPCLLGETKGVLEKAFS